MAGITSSQQEVLVEIGRQLQQDREARGISLDEASRAVRIRSVYIEGIESGNLRMLPELVYVRGFLKSYGDFLELDGEALANRFTQASPQLRQLRSHQSETQGRSPQGIQLRPVHAWLAYVLVVIAAVGGISWFWDRNDINDGNPTTPTANQSTPTSPEEQDFELGPEGVGEFPPFQTLSDWTYIAGVFPDRDQSAITVSGGGTPTSSEFLRLGVQVVDRASWVRVVADSETVFEGTLQPGAEQEWEADESIVLRAGNAGGILLTLNNQQLGAMGDFGEVREQEFQRGVPVELEQ